MCTRFALMSHPEDVRNYFAYENLAEFPARETISPTQPIMSIREFTANKREVVLHRWGLIPHWVKDPDEFTLLLNARAETLTEKPSFKSLIAHKRCLIPADGFYEWSGPKGQRTPYFIKPNDNTLIGFAGLWDHWQGADGSEFESAVIITVPANETIQQIHERMPAIINPADYDAWLNVRDVNAKEAKQLLQPAPNDSLTIEALEPASKTKQKPKPQKSSDQGELF